MKKILILITTVSLSLTLTAPAFAAFTVIKNYKISVTIPESVTSEEAASIDETQAEDLQKEEQMTIMERMWRDSQVLLVKTTVVK